MFCVCLVGIFLKLNIQTALFIMFVFIITRMTFGKTLHYKSPYKCFIMTLAVFLTLFIVCKVNILLSIAIAVFNGYLLTGRANIEDMFMWKGKTSKYDDIMEFVKYNPDKLLDFENRLKEQNNLDFLVYKYRFKDKMSFENISELLDLDSPRISEIQDRIALAIRMYFKI